MINLIIINNLRFLNLGKHKTFCSVESVISVPFFFRKTLTPQYEYL